MTNFEKNIKKSAEGYSLSSDERAKMTRVIREYMAHKPLPREVANPISLGRISWFVYFRRPMAAVLVLVLVFGSGVSFAAENALPGDVLYTVKTSVNEPMRVAFATNAETKAEIQMELAERRIEEATILSVEGRLDDSTQDELAASFKSYAAAVSENIEKAGEEDASASVELAARFETRLIAHESVLAEVEIEMEDGEDSDEDHRSSRLADAIRSTNEILAEARFNRSNVAIDAGIVADISLMATSGAEDSVESEAASMMMTGPAEQENARSAKAAHSSPAAPDARTLSRMQSAAERSLKNAEKTLRNAKYISREAHARAEADIALAGDLIENGEDYLDDDLDADAFAAFEESIRVSEQASVYIKAAPSLEKARSRNSSRNNNSDAMKDVDAGINITLPGAAVNATVTLPTSSPPDNSTTTDTSHDDGMDDQDDPNDDEGDDNRENRDNDRSDGLIKNLLRFNLSL
jgi:hypothetical protein